MNWRSLDLNLLVVFDAVMEARSVTRAGSRLGMTQPAMSHALARLRHSLKDELFVRTPDGMEPTPRAVSLAKPIRHALQDVRFAIEGAESFAPAEADRSFTISVNNYSALVIAAPLAAAARAEAPGVVLDLRPSGTLDIVEQLDRGLADLALGNLAAPGERFRDVRILEDKFVAVVRRGHPSVRPGGAIAAEVLAALPHLAISSNLESTEFVDAGLAALGMERFVALYAPLLAADICLSDSDMVAVISERSARAFSKETGLQLLALPFDSPPLTTMMLWHRRFDDLPAHSWLRNLVLSVARTL